MKKESLSNQNSLFGTATFANTLKLKPAAPISAVEKLGWEKELLGLYISDHPLNIYRAQFEAAKIQPIKEVLASNDERRRRLIGGMISKIQKIMTKTGQPMMFAKIEDLTDTIEVLVFADALQKNPAAWQENKAVLVTGRLSLRNGEAKFICDEAKTL